MVVSEIGEQWSPHTAPAIHAEIEMIISSWFVPENTLTTIGIRIPKVPHEVPVANAITAPITKIIAGRKFISPPAELLTIADTNTDAPRLSVMAFNVQAKVRIRIAGTIALNPSGIHAIQSLKFITRRIRYKTIVITSPKKLPSTSPTDASLCENAVTKSVPLKKPPV